MNNRARLIGIALDSARRLRSDLGFTLMRTFAARGVMSFGSFLFVVVLGHLYGANGVGVYALAQSLVLGIAILGRWGMNNALVRFIGRDKCAPEATAYLWYACKRAAIISVAAALAVFVLRSVISQVFESPPLRSVLIGFSVAAPAYVLGYLLSGLMSAIGRPAAACVLQNGGVAGIATCVVLVMHVAAPSVGLGGIGFAYAVGAWSVLAWGAWAAIRWARANNRGSGRLARDDLRAFNRSASAFLATDIASFLLSVVGVWVAGFLLPIAQVGLYKAAIQLANMIELILSVINLIFPPVFSRLYYAGDLAGLGRLARRGTTIGGVLALAPIAACIFEPRLILSVVGSGFTQAAFALQILATGQFFNLWCGSVGHVLNMSGREAVSRNIAWVSNILGLLVLVVGARLVGVVGLALGVALAMTLQKIVGVYFAWRCVGVWPIPVPNVLRMLHVEVLGTPSSESSARS